MDPNENLRQQRELAERLIRASDDGHFDSMEPEAVRLCELVLALDSWLLKGGALPRGWANRPGTNELAAFRAWGIAPGIPPSREKIIACEVILTDVDKVPKSTACRAAGCDCDRQIIGDCDDCGGIHGEEDHQ